MMSTFICSFLILIIALQRSSYFVKLLVLQLLRFLGIMGTLSGTIKSFCVQV